MSQLSPTIGSVDLHAAGLSFEVAYIIGEVPRYGNDAALTMTMRVNDEWINPHRLLSSAILQRWEEEIRAKHDVELDVQADATMNAIWAQYAA